MSRFSRAHYVLIAKSLNRARNAFQDHIDGGPMMLVIDSCAQTLAVDLAIDNPQFDATHFLAVVKGEREPNSRPPRGGR